MCVWRGPRAPAVKLMFDDLRAARVVPTFLRDTRLGRMVPLALQEECRGYGTDRGLLGRERKAGRASRRMYFSFFFSLS